MAIAGTLVIIPALLLGLLLPFTIFIVLQVWLCKRSAKWLGLILPALTLIVSLVLCLSMAAFGGVRGGSYQVTDEHGNVVEHHQELERVPLTPGAIGAVAGLFLVSNIPTVVFGGIWLHYKNRREWKDDLNKMHIEDLE